MHKHLSQIIDQPGLASPGTNKPVILPFSWGFLKTFQCELVPMYILSYGKKHVFPAICTSVHITTVAAASQVSHSQMAQKKYINNATKCFCQTKPNNVNSVLNQLGQLNFLLYIYFIITLICSNKTLKLLPTATGRCDSV